MHPRNSLLLCFALSGVAAVAACDSSGMGTGQCSGGKCDDPSQITPEQLMPRAPSTSGSIEIVRRGSEWLFEVIGAKGEVVLLSEGYTTRSAALNGVLSAEENGVLAGRYDVSPSGSGFAYVLRAGNGQVLADSQVFSTQSEAESAAAQARDLLADIVQYKAAMTDGAGFQLDKDGSEWSFGLADADGSPLLKSQIYTRRTSALTGIASVRNNGKDAQRYVVLDGPPHFILKAGNGEEIAESASTYPSLDAARAAADSVQALLESERVANPW